MNSIFIVGYLSLVLVFSLMWSRVQNFGSVEGVVSGWNPIMN